MIPFNKPYASTAQTITNKFCGDGEYTLKCNEFFEKQVGSKKSLLTTSCTHALEMAALLLDLNEGDEVILPSYTFVSTANAFVLRKAIPVFIDVRPDTMNMNERLIEKAITNKTKAIVPVHYAGVSCEMDTILDIAKKYQLSVVEDAAQGVGAKYKGKYLGSIGELGCYSFHETKNYHCGEGGALLINNENYVKRAEIIREKGTNRSQFFRGQTDKYTWVDIGSSFLPSELNAAYLYSQLLELDTINNNRLHTWNTYYHSLKPLSESGKIDLPFVPQECQHNAHMFYIKTRDLNERTDLINFLKSREIQTAFHYVPLHSSPAGKKFSRFVGEDKFTTKESDRLLRLPLWYGMKQEQIAKVTESIYDFFKE